MKKMNNKGFALVETLIVSIFVMGIFTLIYTNIVPIMGEYEKRENYDNVNNIYKSYVIRRMIQYYSSLTCNDNIIKIYDKENTNDCSIYSGDPEYCPRLMDNLNVLKIYITKYKGFNNNISDDDKGVKEYVKSLGKFTNKTSSCNCRIIIKYEADVDVEQRLDDGSTVLNKKNQYATIGVKR